MSCCFGERKVDQMEDNKDIIIDSDSAVEDVYGEDGGAEDQLITPWTVSLARFLSLSLSRPLLMMD